MPKYTPLPIVQLDPNNEEGLLRAASSKVYEASGGTLNDFSSGSPIRALLEGQVFAQSEFLNWLNTLPEAILVEWIGPFLGAMRAMGSPSSTTLVFRITPRSTTFSIPAGYTYNTQIEGEESLSFVLTEEVLIPPGSILGSGEAECILIGQEGNVPANSITKINEPLSGLVSVTNPEPAVGGSDMETLNEVKERFFRQIRRRIPVSPDDWVDLVEDTLGTEIQCKVVFNRSARRIHSSVTPLEDNHHVALYILNQDNSPLTTLQLDLIKSVVSEVSPIGIQVNIYPLDNKVVDTVIELSYYRGGIGRSSRSVSSFVRDSLMAMTDTDVRVNDLERRVYDSFSGSEYPRPDIRRLSAYVCPPLATEYEDSLSFRPTYRIRQGDLIIKETLGEKKYYSASVSFNPATFSKPYHINTGELSLKEILPLESRPYEAGDIIGTVEGDLYFATSGFTSQGDIDPLNMKGPLTPAAWSQGTLYDPYATGSYEPIIFTIEQDEINHWLEPEALGGEPLNRRAGWFVAVVTKSFTSVRSTSDLSIARSLFLISDREVSVQEVFPGFSYSPGTYVVDQTGSYYRSLKGFSIAEEDFPRYSDAFQELVEEGTLVQVEGIQFEDDNGNSFEGKEFLYNARFRVGEYLRYRPLGGTDVGSREDCLEQLSDDCRQIISTQYRAPSYYMALRDFTPWTNDIQVMVDAGAILPVEYPPFTERAKVSPLPEVGQCEYICPVSEGGETETNSETKFRDIFHLSPGDVVSIYIPGKGAVSYMAKKHFTPIFSPDCYLDDYLMEAAPSLEPNRDMYPEEKPESIIISPDGLEIYRSLASFTPSTTSAGDVKTSELNGKLLKVVKEITGFEKFLSEYESLISISSPGSTLIRTDDGSLMEYRWDSEGVLTHETGVKESSVSLDYGEGTLAL